MTEKITHSVEDLQRMIKSTAPPAEIFVSQHGFDETAYKVAFQTWWAGQVFAPQLLEARARITELEAALHDNNVVLETLHTSGAKADYPGYLIGMGDLYELQAQIDANNELLGIEPE